MTVDAKPARADIWSTFRESPLAVKTILVGQFVNRLGGFLNLFLVLYLTATGYSIPQATIAFGIYGAGTVVGVLVGGALSERLGPRNATVLSMGGTALLTACLLYLPSYPILLLTAAVLGLVSRIYGPASAALLSELTSATRQIMIFAMYRFGINVGAMAAPLLGFALYNLGHQRYTLLFWGEALIAAAYAVLAYLTLPARTTNAPGHGDGAATETAGSYVDVLRDRRFTLFLVFGFLNTLVYVQYLSTLPLDITTSGLPVFWYTMAVFLNGLMVICFELLVTKVSQHWPFRVTIGLAVALVGAGMAFYGLPLGPGVIIIGTLIWTVAEIIGAPAAFAYPAVAGPAHLKARYIGGFQFVFALGSAAGPIVGGALFSSLGHRVWPVLALFSVVALVCVLLGVQNAPASAVAASEPEAHGQPPRGAHERPEYEWEAHERETAIDAVTPPGAPLIAE